jgi:hypothetical protein
VALPDGLGNGEHNRITSPGRTGSESRPPSVAGSTLA